jgi:HPt (histidine-containing phosphotransfer) domain-containing protein
VETLDTTVIDELRSLDDEDLRDIVEMYFTDVVDQVDNMRSSLETGDCDGVASAAHRVKGASLSMGAARVAGLASDTEIAARDGDLSPCAELVTMLEREIEPTREALGNELHVALS